MFHNKVYFFIISSTSFISSFIGLYSFLILISISKLSLYVFVIAFNASSKFLYTSFLASNALNFDSGKYGFSVGVCTASTSLYLLAHSVSWVLNFFLTKSVRLYLLDATSVSVIHSCGSVYKNLHILHQMIFEH